MGLGAGVAIIMVAVAASVGGYAIVNEYVPIVGEEITNLEVISPPGNYLEISEAEVFDTYPFVETMFKDAPHKDDVLYKGFETDASITDIMDYYADKLTDKGYGFYADGAFAVSGYTVSYTSYLKGATAVGIVVNDEVADHGTLVGYITGNGRYLEDLVNWFKSEVS